MKTNDEIRKDLANLEVECIKERNRHTLAVKSLDAIRVRIQKECSHLKIMKHYSPYDNAKWCSICGKEL